VEGVDLTAQLLDCWRATRFSTRSWRASRSVHHLLHQILLVEQVLDVLERGLEIAGWAGWDWLSSETRRRVAGGWGRRSGGSRRGILDDGAQN